MAIDFKAEKKKLFDQKPSINLIPLIDILFTILIFLVVTSSFSADVTQDAADATGKPNITDTSGDAEFYVMPLANLHTVTVNGQDMSYLIKKNAIGIHAKVLDTGTISIRPGEIIITTPADMSPYDAVKSPV